MLRFPKTSFIIEAHVHGMLLFVLIRCLHSVINHFAKFECGLTVGIMVIVLLIFRFLVKNRGKNNMNTHQNPEEKMKETFTKLEKPSQSHEQTMKHNLKTP